MPRFRALLCASAMLAALLFLPSASRAQTASSGTVVGTVTDSTGASIPGAQVDLKNNATNLVQHQSTNLAGAYVFSSVLPGTYTLTITANGFQKNVITNVAVEVNKSFTINPKLTVGAQTQTVEVTASSQAELQTINATVGNVINEQSIDRLPTVQHDTVELLGLQPATLGSGAGTRVNGAIDDQNTIKLDGVDISGHVLAGATTSVESLPTPEDSVEEFRVGVSNNNASFNNSSGADITLVGRRGSNDFHGSAYFYNQNQHFNANSWTNDRAGIAKTPFTDNRFGARLGGPIRKDKDFFFVNYEGRRFPATSTVTRIVPTASLRQGILKFTDASGNVDSYNLATAADCGPGGASACDPRGLGISPAIQKLFSEDPTGNLNSVGDGLNTTGYIAPIKTPENTDYEVVRYDHTFNSRWQLHTSATYFRDLVTSSGQVNTLGGNAVGTLVQPKRDTAFSGTLVGQISPTLFNTFTFGFMRDFSVSQPLSPTSAAVLEGLPGTNTADGYIALQTAADGLNLPIDNSAGAARYQWTKVVDLQFVDDATWLVGNHTYQFGADIRSFPTTHARNDKVVAGDSSLAAVMDASNFLTIPSVDAPPTCTSTLTSNCLTKSETSTWDSLYATTLGMVDNVNIEAARDASLNPLPFGTTLQANARWQAYNFYGTDVWRATPSLTLSYGLAYGWQTPPVERDQKQVLLESTSGQVLTASGYLGAKQAAAAAGQFYNPALSYVPVRYAGQQVFNTDYGDVSPRLSAAWNPSYTSGLLGSVLGDRKSVLRGGVSIVYDRTNMVQNVEIPMLGVGFAQTLTVAAPLCNASGTPGAGCNSAIGTATDPGAASFRVGWDGNIPLPAFAPITNPQNGVIPGINGEQLSFQLDPQNKVGRSLTADLTWQRQLNRSMLLELGWTSDYGRDLPEGINFNNSPYMFVDPASGQSFAQAYDAIEQQLASGVAGSKVTPQTWFEDMVPGGTDAFVGANSTNFNSASVSKLFQSIDNLRMKNGLPTFNNQQVGTLFMRTHQGISNYNAFIATLRMNPAHGFNFDLNYTRSKLLSNGLGDQDSAGFFADGYDTFHTYGVDPSDRTNTFNATYNYNLPHTSGSNAWLNKLTSGWYHSGIFTYASGAPLTVSEGSQVFGGGTLLSGSAGAIAKVNPDSLTTGLYPNLVAPGSSIASRGLASNGGLGFNLFADPASVFNDFRMVRLSADGRSGDANVLRGYGTWNWNGAVGKSTAITEKMNLVYTLQVFNVLNHGFWNNPSLGLFGVSPLSFGVLTGKSGANGGGYRTMEMGLRVEF